MNPLIRELVELHEATHDAILTNDINELKVALFKTNQANTTLLSAQERLTAAQEGDLDANEAVSIATAEVERWNGILETTRRAFNEKIERLTGEGEGEIIAGPTTLATEYADDLTAAINLAENINAHSTNAAGVEEGAAASSSKDTDETTAASKKDAHDTDGTAASNAEITRDSAAAAGNPEDTTEVEQQTMVIPHDPPATAAGHGVSMLDASFADMMQRMTEVLSNRLGTEAANGFVEAAEASEAARLAFEDSHGGAMQQQGMEILGAGAGAGANSDQSDGTTE